MRYSPSKPRHAAATVEFALVAPLLFTLVFAAIEAGRAMMAMDLMANTARTGCRVGVLPGNSNSDVTSATTSQLSNSGISNATVSITVNGATADVSTANEGDQIGVTVSVTNDSISCLPSSWFFGGTTLTRSIIMRHE